MYKNNRFKLLETKKKQRINNEIINNCQNKFIYYMGKQYSEVIYFTFAL